MPAPTLSRSERHVCTVPRLILRMAVQDGGVPPKHTNELSGSSHKRQSASPNGNSTRCLWILLDDCSWSLSPPMRSHTPAAHQNASRDSRLPPRLERICNTRLGSAKGRIGRSRYGDEECSASQRRQGGGSLQRVKVGNPAVT